MTEDSLDSEELEEDVEARAFEHVFLKPIQAKTNVRAQTTCKLLAMEKRHLDDMRLDYKEELGLLLAEAQRTMVASLQRKLEVVRQKR